MAMPSGIQRRMPWFLRRGDSCRHVRHIRPVPQKGDRCPQCAEEGDTWVHLRQCLTCGQMGCCDQSRNKHATAHFRESSHPVMRSAEPDEDWMWCYVDERMVAPP